MKIKTTLLEKFPVPLSGPAALPCRHTCPAHAATDCFQDPSAFPSQASGNLHPTWCSAQTNQRRGSAMTSARGEGHKFNKQQRFPARADRQLPNGSHYPLISSSSPQHPFSCSLQRAHLGSDRGHWGWGTGLRS